VLEHRSRCGLGRRGRERWLAQVLLQRDDSSEAAIVDVPDGAGKQGVPAGIITSRVAIVPAIVGVANVITCKIRKT
jgi:hypothetical protein